jgi:hypothetical protein
MADDSVQIEYNQDLRALERLLASVKRAGDFFVSGTIEIPMPKVVIDGVGILSFPVPLAQTHALIKQATRAPYGQGEQTILDESIRKVWQLPPQQVQIGGKSWQASFATIRERVAAGLGCEGPGISAELYKLLIYDQGGFFRAHRDTEKAEGMFGTMVLVLPSPHAGGDLLIRHAGRQATIDMSRVDVSEISFAAFYADCEHEVQPIITGNRICLVYSLMQGPAVKARKSVVGPPDNEAQTAAVAALLKSKLAGPAAPPKIAWLLEHQYTPHALSFRGLKSADAARAKVLIDAATRAGCAAHLGIVHIEEFGSAQENYDGYRRRGWGRYGYDDDQDEADSSNDFEIIEVADGRHYISDWRDACDRPVEFGEIPLGPGELLPRGALDKEKPDKQKFMEATGNEGGSFERSYCRTALVIWPRERYAEVLLQAGAAAALPYLTQCVAAAEQAQATLAEREAAVSVARQIVRAWQQPPEFADAPSSPGKRAEMLRLLHRLGDAAILEKFISTALTRHYDRSDNVALVESLDLLGPKKAARLFAEIIRSHMRYLQSDCINLLCLLQSGLSARPAIFRSSDLRQLVEAAVSKLDEVGVQPPDTGWMDWMEIRQAQSVDAEFVRKLLEATNACQAPDLREQAVSRFIARPNVFDPVTVLVPALKSTQEADPATRRLWEHSAQFLLERSEFPPAAPADWRQEVELQCSCPDCRELQAFARDPLEQTHRFRVRKDRRQHLHRTIEEHHLEMEHLTDRQGSPQTLVCIKNRAGYEKRCQQYRTDAAALKSLVRNAGPLRPAAIFLERIGAALKLSADWTRSQRRG